MRRALQALSIVALSARGLVATPATTPLLGINMVKGGESLSVPMQIVILLTLMTLLPAAIMSITPFLRIAIVLHFLRQALGTQNTPSNQVLLGIALFLTTLVISPVAADMYHQGWEPLQKNEISTEQAFDAGTKPLKAFLIRFAREKDIKLFVDITHSAAPHTPVGSGATDSDSGLYPFGVESRISNRRSSLPSFFDHRSGGCFSDPLNRYGAIAARHDLRSVQNPVVRAGRWLAPRSRIPHERFLRMTPEYAIQIIREALLTAFWLSAPLLAVGFIAGLLISLVQILTSIQDTAFNAIPRLLAFLATFILALPWMLQKMTRIHDCSAGRPQPLCTLT